MPVKGTRRILQLLKNKRGMVAGTPPEEPSAGEMPPEMTPEPFPTEPAETAATPTETPSGPKEGSAEPKEGKKEEEGKPGEQGKAKPEEKPKPQTAPGKYDKYGAAEKSLKNKNLPKPPYWLMGLIIFGILSGVLITKTGTTENIIPKLGAIIPLVLLPASILVIKKGNEKKEAGDKNYYLTAWLGWLLLLGSFYGLGTRTTPYAMAAVQSGDLSLSNIGVNTAGGVQGAVQTTGTDIMSSWNRNMQIASGQSIEGDVEQTQKEDVGLDILPPYLPNPKKINQNEMEMLEIAARIKGFDPKAEMTATVVCSMQSRKEVLKTGWTNIGELQLHPGEQQDVSPATIKGIDFDKEVTCYPKPTTCGDYIVTLTAEADHLRTDAHMENYIIDKKVFIEKIKNYAQSRNTVLRSDAEVSTAVKNIYPEIGDYKSVSDKGAIKVVLATQKAPLIPVGGAGEDESDLTLRVALENMMNGWIISVNEVEVTIPQYFMVKQGYCKNWIVEGDKIRLGESYLRNASFKDATKGLQKVFPSCHLVPTSTADLTEPRQATFLAKVDYNYIVQSKNDIQIRTETGETCEEQRSTPASGGQTTTGQGTTTGTQTAGQDITACQGKNEGDTCAEKQMCLSVGGQMKCSTECKYNAAKAQRGLTSSYDCETQQSRCAEGTVRSFSCKSIATTEEGTCCIRRT